LIHYKITLCRRLNGDRCQRAAVLCLAVIGHQAVAVDQA